jgi:hypothetical protein
VIDYLDSHCYAMPPSIAFNGFSHWIGAALVEKGPFAAPAL